MTLGLIGKKVGMTQIFSEEGDGIPVTVIEAGPCMVVTKKTPETDGYCALQLSFGNKKESKVSLPVKGIYKKVGLAPGALLREFRVSDSGTFEVGQKVTVELFSIGEKVAVTGRSKGRGFAGVIKRWGFSGGKDTHGSMFHRAPGSIGASADPSRVLKGTRLPGHHGDAQITVRNLSIVDIKPEQNLVLVKGAIPGGKRGIVLIKKLT
jgi:large subunit ribosomal protein L3